MTAENQARMNAIGRQIKELADEFRLETSLEAQFCRGLLSQSLATMDMKLSCEYGVKLDTRPLPPAPAPEPEPESKPKPKVKK